MVSREVGTAIFGFGPGYLSKSYNDRGSLGEFNSEIEYGLNGYSWFLLQYGFLGLVFYLWFLNESFLKFAHRRINILNISIFVALVMYAPDIVNIPLILFLSLALKLVRDDEQKYFITYTKNRI